MADLKLPNRLISYVKISLRTLIQQMNWSRAWIHVQQALSSSRIGIPSGCLDDTAPCLEIMTVV